jgi:hypothetical protein
VHVSQRCCCIRPHPICIHILLHKATPYMYTYRWCLHKVTHIGVAPCSCNLSFADEAAVLTKLLPGAFSAYGYCTTVPPERVAVCNISNHLERLLVRTSMGLGQASRSIPVALSTDLGAQ